MPTYNLTIYPNAIHLNRIKKLTGHTIGKLLVLGYAGHRNGQAMWHCLCQCGSVRTILGDSLTSKRLPTRSCGCLRFESRNMKHGESVNGIISPEYRAYRHAKQRCENPNDPKYRIYGARGIEFRLISVDELLDEIGRRPTAQHSLDRIDTNGHYEKGNLRWTLEQQRNVRKNVNLTFQDRTQCMAAWATEYGLSNANLWTRLHNNWCMECALTIPIRQGTCTHIGQPTKAEVCWT